MKPTFENTVDILVKAYMTNTLLSGSCNSCAVANIIRANGCDSIDLASESTNWILHIDTVCRKGYARKYDVAVAVEQINASGYDIWELDRIERAFEHDSEGIYDLGEDHENLVRLMAVVDVLADIHGVDLTTAEQAKALFVKP